MHEDYRNLKPVKRQPLSSTEKERDEFDKMFWASVDPGYAPEDGVCDDVDHVPQRDAEQVREQAGDEGHQSLQQNDESPLERLIREQREKYA